MRRYLAKLKASVATRHVLGESLWVLLGQIATVLGTLALIRVNTTFLVPETYGYLTLALTISGFSAQTVVGALGAGLSRYYSISLIEGGYSDYIRAVMVLSGLCILSIISAAAMILPAIFFFFEGKGKETFILAVIYAVTSGVNFICASLQNTARNRRSAAFHAILDIFLRITLTTIALNTLSPSASTILFGYISANIGLAVSQLLSIRRQFPLALPNRDAIKRWKMEIAKFSWPFLIFGVFAWLQASSDRWALAQFGTPDDVGMYAVVFQLGFMPMSIITSFIGTILTPILYQVAGNNTDGTQLKYAGAITTLMTVSCLIFTTCATSFAMIFHADIFSAIASEPYAPASRLLPWAILAGGLFGAAQLLSLKLLTHMKPHFLLAPRIGSAIAGVLLSVVGAKLWGSNGVVCGLVAFSALSLIWIWTITRSTGKPVPD